MKKKFLLLLIDSALVVLGYALAYVISVETKKLQYYIAIFLQTLPILLAAKSLVFYVTGMYKPLWRYASVNAILLMFKAAFFASCIFVISLFFLNIKPPRSVLIVDGLLTLFLIGFSRFMIRYMAERSMSFFGGVKGKEAKARKPILIYGAGDAGEMILREIKTNRGISEYLPVGFIDDFKDRGQRIHNVPILGTLKDLPQVIRRHHIEELIIAISRIGGEKTREIVHQCRTLGVRFKLIPRIGDIVNGEVDPSHLRDLDISDLLKRNPQNLNHEGIRNFIKGKRILVTGAGGTIGQELCHQMASCDPEEMILIEKTEHHLYCIKTKLNDAHPKLRLSTYLTSVTDAAKVAKIFEAKRPHIVFHAAAYKHVHLCEENICESVINNVEGTIRVANAAHKYGADKFIFISTDKAVNPTGIMGATKKIGELYVQNRNARSETRFITVRFGNVLESSGSAVPRFKEQINRREPVFVTDPEVTRYFMLIEEAVQLIMQGASMGQGGEIFVLDMGSPIKVVDMVKDLITLMGLRPYKDIPIIFTSLRPGEKLHEQLYEDSLEMKYAHPSIMAAKPPLTDWDELNQNIERLLWDAYQDDVDGTLKSLKVLLPQFNAFEKGAGVRAGLRASDLAPRLD